jgi:sphingomyelin phosphodiesterase acid-like 3
MTYLSRRTFLELASASVLCGCGSSEGITVSSDFPVLAFSDVHFNPLYDPTLVSELDAADHTQWDAIFKKSLLTTPSLAGADTNYPLFTRALASLHQNLGSSPFVLYTGDLLGHGISYYYPLYSGNSDVTAMQKFTDKAVAFITQQIRAALGDIPVFFAVGNCDSYTGYGPDSVFLGNTADSYYAQLLNGSIDHQTFTASFTAGGYYVAEPKGTKVMVIGLNTIQFSPLVQNSDGSENNATQVDAELAWFDTKLASAKAAGKKVWLLMHAPPGADEGSTAKTVSANGHLAAATMMWEPNYQASFMKIVAKYPGVIAMTLAGHTHMDEFRIMSPGNVVEIVPGISPVFGNDPAFKVFSMDRTTLAPADFSSFNYDLSKMPSGFASYYNFSAVYPSKTSLASSLETLCPVLVTNATLQSRYRGYFYSGNNIANLITDANWAVYWAGIDHMWAQDLTNAVNSYS